jgi:hypothetical protein
MNDGLMKHGKGNAYERYGVLYCTFKKKSGNIWRSGHSSALYTPEKEWSVGYPSQKHF